MAGAADKVKLIVSYGGELRRCPVSGMPRYIGGENLLVKIGLSERLAGLRSRLAARAGCPDVRIRYATVEEGLDRLHDVESDGDVWRLITLLYYRAAGVAINDDCCRVRAFLLPAGDGDARSTVACMRHSASSPALRHAISELNTGSMSTTTTSSQRSSNTCANNANKGASSLQRAQSAGSALFHNATKKIDLAIRRAYSRFEAEAMVAAAAEQQKFSSATKVDEATTITPEDSGLEPRAVITSEQRNPSSSATKSSSGGSTDASRACSRIEAVAAQQNMVVARPAPVIFLPPPPGVAVLYYYPVIPV
jgi:hypothetical protein